MIKKKLAIALLVLGSLMLPLFGASQAAAGNESPQQRACQGAGGSWQNGQCVNEPFQGAGLTETITNIINVMLYLIGVVAVIMIIVGAFRYITSHGDSSQISAAKNTIMYAVIGLVVAIAAFAIVNFVLSSF